MTRWSQDPILPEEAGTLDGLFHRRARRDPERLAYRWFNRTTGTWQALTWEEAFAQVARWRAALADEGFSAGTHAALVLRNCPEWVFFEQAVLSLGGVTVPLYTDDRPDNAAYILRDAEVAVLLVQDVGRWKRLAPALTEAPRLQRVILLDDSAEARRVAASDARVVLAADWLPDCGTDWSPQTGRFEQLATIVYTSGTTGKPKGVMLSHGNILSNAAAGLQAFTVYQEDEFLSFLPLSHMLERTVSHYLPMMAGASVTYARSVTQLSDDLRQIRPTLMVAVPRVFERVYQRLHERMRARAPWVRALFHLTARAGWLAFEHQQGRRGWHPLVLLWPWLRWQVARPVLAQLGGRLRTVVSGGAPLPAEVARLFLGLGLPLLQGYGLTETSPVISVNRLEDNRPDTVGIALAGVEVRLGEDDEVQVRGPNVMQGYWRLPEASAAVQTADGWFKTGDQGRFIGRHLMITGRIKDILVLSNGEKVPPANMEMALRLDPLFEQALIVGEGRAYLGALLVLNAEHWPPFARQLGLDPDAPASLHEPRVLKAVLQRVAEALRDFPGYAKVRRVALLREPWTIDNGLITPSLKVKRREVSVRYRAEIERLYADGDD